jgi:C1A family cysteine protease
MLTSPLAKLALSSLLILPLNLYAKTLTHKKRVSSSFSSNEKTLNKVFVAEFIKRGGSEKEYIKLKEEKSYFEVKKMVEVAIEEKKFSRGQSVIERQKAKVRALIAAKNGSKSMTGKEKIAAMLAKNKQQLKNKKSKESKSFQDSDIFDLAKTYEDNLIAEKEKMDQSAQKWINNYNKSIRTWAKEREKFLSNLDEVKKHVVKPESMNTKFKEKKTRTQLKEITQVKEKVVSKLVTEGLFYIDKALDVPIRNQHRRGTCTSFAAMRSLDILLLQNDIEANMSEQYFYWSSKPKCKETPCRGGGGSFAGRGFKFSSKQLSPDIPKEEDCSYTKKEDKDNETQTPLEYSCNKGFVKVESFGLTHNLNEVVSALNNNSPVLAGIHLSENFYKNKGLVLASEVPKNFNSKDKHAGGHAVLFVGLMKLPKSLQRKEGKFCVLAANSWGVGWGKGGHACLSERWINKYKMKNHPFVIVEKVSI